MQYLIFWWMCYCISVCGLSECKEEPIITYICNTKKPYFHSATKIQRLRYRPPLFVSRLTPPPLPWISKRAHLWFSHVIYTYAHTHTNGDRNRNRISYERIHTIVQWKIQLNRWVLKLISQTEFFVCCQNISIFCTRFIRLTLRVFRASHTLCDDRWKHVDVIRRFVEIVLRILKKMFTARGVIRVWSVCFNVYLNTAQIRNTFYWALISWIMWNCDIGDTDYSVWNHATNDAKRIFFFFFHFHLERVRGQQTNNVLRMWRK